MVLKEEIKKLKESSKKRNFTQRFDLIITLKDFDFKKSENKVDEIFVLPKIPGKPASITIFSESSKKLEDVRIVSKEKIEDLAENKKERKKIVKDTTLFLSEPKLMPVVGKHLGKFLAPVGKMPKPVVGDIKDLIKDYKRGVRVKTGNQPMLQFPLGSEDMKDEDVAENIKALINFVIRKLPKGRNNISDVYLKLTMSKPIKLEDW